VSSLSPTALLEGTTGKKLYSCELNLSGIPKRIEFAADAYEIWIHIEKGPTRIFDLKKRRLQDVSKNGPVQMATINERKTPVPRIVSESRRGSLSKLNLHGRTDIERADEDRMSQMKLGERGSIVSITGRMSDISLLNNTVVKKGLEYTTNVKVEIQRAAGCVAIASMSVGAEGVIQFISSGLQVPTSELAGSENVFPPSLKYSASAGLTAIFVMGIFIAILPIFYDTHWAELTGCVTALSPILALYYFFVYYVAEPAFNWDKHLASVSALPLPPPGGWETEFRERITFWLGYFVPMMCISAMALSFQFLSLYKLYNLQFEYKPSNPLTQALIYFYFSVLVFTIGIGILTVAGWVRVQEGPNSLSSPVAYPPSVIVYPDPAVISGIAVIAYGLAHMLYSGILYKLKGEIEYVTLLLKLLSFGAYCWLLGIHDMMQISLASASLAGVGGYIALLLVPVVFAPVYYMGQTIEAISNY